MNTKNKITEIVLHDHLLDQIMFCLFNQYRKTDAATGSEPFDKLSSEKAYQMVFELRLTEELLVSNGFPRPGKRPGTAIIQNTKPTRKPNDTERYCIRCGKVFNLSMYDQICVDECNYHPKSTGYKRGKYLIKIL